jgi:hypothetical protein
MGYMAAAQLTVMGLKRGVSPIRALEMLKESVMSSFSALHRAG